MKEAAVDIAVTIGTAWALTIAIVLLIVALFKASER